MNKEYISIQEAAELSNKSIQTIRRTIKAKKIKYRKQRTPQGFNYYISRTSLCELYRIRIKEDESRPRKTKFKPVIEAEAMTIEVEDFKSFVKTIESMLAKHSEERQNFLRLVNTLQERIFILENQINLLKGAPQKKWYQFWK